MAFLIEGKKHQEPGQINNIQNHNFQQIVLDDNMLGGLKGRGAEGWLALGIAVFTHTLF